MNFTPDMFVGAITTAILTFGAVVLGSRTLKASFDPGIKRASLKQDVYRVSWRSLAVGYLQFPIASLPVAVLVLSPNPGAAGYIVFGGAAFAWACLAVWYIRKLGQTYVEFTDDQLIYCDGRHSKTLLYGRLRSVFTSSGHIVCLDTDGVRFVIPLQFAGNEMILARLRSICEKVANPEDSAASSRAAGPRLSKPDE